MQRKFTFAISSPDEFLVAIRKHGVMIIKIKMAEFNIL